VALAWSRFHLGSGIHTDLLGRASALGADSLPEAFQDLTYFVRSETKWGLLLAFVDEVDEARAKLESLRTFVLEQHLDDFVPHVLSFLGHVEYLAGNWDEALHHAEESEDEASQLGQSMLRGQGLFIRAVVAAHRGRAEALRASADETSVLFGRSGYRWARQLGALGLLELSRGNAAEAHAHLHVASELAAAAGYAEPAVMRFHHDHIDALVALGELEQAGTLVEWLEDRAQALGRPWGLAVSARCRGLICAARGDLPAAQHALERALEAHERLPQPFERARTLLVLGQVRRRARQKRPAREPLEEALAIFEAVGAPLWAEKARAELARIGGRAPSAGELTSTERRVAELVAEGRSNKEVAAALFVTPKTVEANLSRVYAKLGARSRTELARRLRGPNGASKV
jgi:DNA-binding CsgD family transcriptional regulator